MFGFGQICHVLPLLCVLRCSAAARCLLLGTAWLAAVLADEWDGVGATCSLCEARINGRGCPPPTAPDDQLGVVWEDLGRENGAIHHGGLLRGVSHRVHQPSSGSGPALECQDRGTTRPCGRHEAAGGEQKV